MSVSNPYMKIANDFGIAHADVYNYAAWLDKTTVETNDAELGACERLTYEQKKTIAAAVKTERDRRYAVQKEMRA